MAWVVDTSVLLDIRLNDPVFGAASSRCLLFYQGDGLTLSPVSYVKLAPAFGGAERLQQEFLRLVGVDWLEPWTSADTAEAHGLWASCVSQRRSGHAAKRPVADVLIEAFAKRFQGLITRNPRHFTTVRTVDPTP